MSEYIDSEINRLEEIYDLFGGSVARDETLRLLKTLKQAEEALKSCEDFRTRNDYGYWVDSEKVDAALASMAALGKDE